MWTRNASFKLSVSRLLATEKSPWTVMAQQHESATAAPQYSKPYSECSSSAKSTLAIRLLGKKQSPRANCTFGLAVRDKVQRLLLRSGCRRVRHAFGAHGQGQSVQAIAMTCDMSTIGLRKKMSRMRYALSFCQT
ncbi:hypothetical protein Psta_3419 [Pirellula staleyi DSM 6068]|uniref:Uncharacterized protein n=1 Tax=Pirellula staleyi (strain ATCC 27377 / DSM 6068 / ICPB 4128) TaxID=530564 RepID=D2QY06_PIRSD|nr:hypothetical protein Psta_3419 [Pirellula staleyi DSM 6068]